MSLSRLPKKFDIFISYHRESFRYKVREFIQRLRQHNLKIWFDDEQLNEGERLYDRIERGIRDSEIVLCFINQKYINSDNCINEISLANELKIKIIDIMLERNLLLKQSNGIAIIVAAKHRLNAYKYLEQNADIYSLIPWSQAGYDKLLTAISNLKSGREIPINLDTMDYERICGLCENDFDLDDHRPKLIECKRVFCISCLKKFFPINDDMRYYKCCFHDSEHAFPANRVLDQPSYGFNNVEVIKQFELLPEPLSIKRRLEYEAHKVNVKKCILNFERLEALSKEMIQKVNNNESIINHELSNQAKLIGFDTKEQIQTEAQKFFNVIRFSMDISDVKNKLEVYLWNNEFYSNDIDDILEEINKNVGIDVRRMHILCTEFEGHFEVVKALVNLHEANIRIEEQRIVNLFGVLELSKNITGKLEFNKPEINLKIKLFDRECMLSMDYFQKNNHFITLYPDDFRAIEKCRYDADNKEWFIACKQNHKGFTGLCLPQEKNEIWIIDNINKHICVYGENYEVLRNPRIQNATKKIRYRHIEHCSSSKLVYLFEETEKELHIYDENLELLDKYALNDSLDRNCICMKIIDDIIYICTDERALAYNLGAGRQSDYDIIGEFKYLVPRLPYLFCIKYDGTIMVNLFKTDILFPFKDSFTIDENIVTGACLVDDNLYLTYFCRY